MTIRHYLIAIGLASLVACRSTPTNSGTKDSTHVDTTAAKTSAIDGLVLKGPISPVQRQGDPNEAPLAGAPVTIANTGTYDSPLHLISDSNGHFSAKVSAGTYSITPNSIPGQSLPRPMNPTTVTVPANAVAFDTLHYDTGIR
jgi:hypothetical protein